MDTSSLHNSVIRSVLHYKGLAEGVCLGIPPRRAKVSFDQFFYLHIKVKVKVKVCGFTLITVEILIQLYSTLYPETFQWNSKNKQPQSTKLEHF